MLICVLLFFPLQELIPEFFCLPEMFTNMNGYKLGRMEPEEEGGGSNSSSPTSMQEQVALNCI